MQSRREWVRERVKARRAFVADLGRWEDEKGKRHWPLWPLLISPLWAIPLAARRLRYSLDKKAPTVARRETMARFTSAVIGTPIPRAFGRVGRITGSVIFASDYSGGRNQNGNIRPDYVAPVSSQNAGAKVFVTCAVLVCAGPVSSVTRIWANDTLIYKNGPGYTTGYVDYSDSITIYLGTDSQGIDPHLEELNPLLTPAYRGRCYVVFHGFDLARFDNQIPRFEFEVQETGSAVYQTETLTLSSLDADALILSRKTPFLYAYAADVLHAISRVDFSQSYEVNLVDQLDAFSPGASIVGRISLDDASGEGALDSLVFGAQDTSGAGFLFVWGPLGARSNADSAIAGAEFLECFGLGPLIYAADTNGAGVCAFRRDTLALVWSRSGPDSAAVPGNFTHDGQGRAWLISYDPAAPATGASSQFWLSRYTAGGEVVHHEITGRGRCKQVAISVVGNNEFALCGGGDGGDLVRVRIDAPTLTVIAQEAGVTADGQRSLFLSQYRFRDHRFLSSDGDSLFRINTQNGGIDLTETIPDIDHGLRVVGPAYDPLRDTLYSAEDAPGGGLVSVTLGRVESSSKSLAALVSDLCQLAGLAGGEIDVTASALTGTAIEGYLVDDASTAEQALEPVLETYRLGVCESAGVLLFRSLAPDSPLFVSEDDLGAGSGGQPDTELYGEQVEDPDEIPASVEIEYTSATRDYSRSVQRWQHRADIFPGLSAVGASTPLVLTDTTARQIAQIIALSAERESLKYTLALGPKYLEIDAGDALSFDLSTDPEAEVVRVESVEVGADLVLRVSACRADADSYSSALEGAGAPASEAEIFDDAPSVGVVLDLPALRDMDGSAGLYFGAGPLGPGRWLGAQLHQSADGGASFDPVLVTSDSVAIGRALTRLQAPQSDGPTLDPQNVTVLALSGSYSAASLSDLLEDKTLNLLAVGSASTAWELVQYTSVTDNGDGTVTLSNFLRGRFGTEHAQDTHGEGEIVVECDPAKLRRLLLSNVEFLAVRQYKTATLNSAIDGAQGEELTVNLISLKPWAPVSLAAYQLSGATKDTILLWLRRPRIGGELQDLTDAPPGEDLETYEVEILVGGAVIRTLTATMPAPAVVNLAATAATQKITRASGDWAADGIHAGCAVELAGFSNAANVGIFTVATAPSATEITLAGGATALVDEASAAGRTVTRISPLAVWTQAQQIADLGAVATTVTFRVYQNSAIVGRGYVSETKTQAL